MHWVLAEYPDVFVFWVHASSRERFELAYLEIARECRIPGYDEIGVDKLKIVKDWLEKKSNRRWLMVLDNADDVDLFFGGQGNVSVTDENPVPLEYERLADAIPRCTHGAVLITTRNKQVGIKLATSRNTFEVGALGKDESRQLMMERLGEGDHDEAQLDALIESLDRLPLALAQAAAFIDENSMPVDQYIELLQGGDDNLIELLSQPFEDDTRDFDVPNAVAITLSISFLNLVVHHDFASRLLFLISYLDKQDIPRFLLDWYHRSSTRDEAAAAGHGKDLPKGRIEFEKAIGVIKGFSFISEGGAGDSVNMHRLTQLVLRKFLVVQEVSDTWRGVGLSALLTEFPLARFENWAICARLLPHALSILENTSFDTLEYPMMRARLQMKVGIYLVKTGKDAEAETFMLPATDLSRKLQGDTDDESLVFMGNLASVYNDLGRRDEAETLVTKVIETKKKTSAQDPLGVCHHMNTLVLIYQKQGRLTEAKKVAEDVVETRERLLGEDNPLTLTSMTNLALILWGQGQLKEAGKLEERVLESRTRLLGQDHPDTLSIANNYAITLHSQRRLIEAVTLMTDCYTRMLRILGADHKNTIAARQDLTNWTAELKK